MDAKLHLTIDNALKWQKLQGDKTVEIKFKKPPVLDGKTIVSIWVYDHVLAEGDYLEVGFFGDIKTYLCEKAQNNLQTSIEFCERRLKEIAKEGC